MGVRSRYLCCPGRCGIADLALELVSAAVASPQMADTAVIEILAPLRGEQGGPALRTGHDRPRSMKAAYTSGSELHDASSLSLSLPARCPMPHASDGIVTVHTRDMKQRR